MYYSSFGALTVVILVINNIQILKRVDSEENSTVHRRYRQFLYSLILFCVADIFWGMLYEVGIIPLVYLDTALFFVTMGLTVYLWMRYIVEYLDRRGFFSKAITYAGAFIFAFQFVTLIVNLFIPIVFKFDRDTKEYLPGKARYVMLSLQVVLFAVTAVYPLMIAKHMEGKDKLRHNAIGISGIVMTVFIVLQTIYPFLPFYAVGCLIGCSIIHSFVELDQKEEFDRQIGSFRKLAYKDALTNVRNKTAFAEQKFILDKMIKEGALKDFGVVVFDVNNLKVVNDTYGHDEGDKYIRRGCKLICNSFKHSPVFRIGGDEFVAFLEGDAYKERGVLLTLFNDRVNENLKSGGVVVSAGMSVFDPAIDRDFDSVFDRADKKMYDRKNELKSNG